MLSHDAHMTCLLSQNLEAEVNLHFPWSLKGDKHGKFLLCRQLRRLQVKGFVPSILGSSPCRFWEGLGIKTYVLIIQGLGLGFLVFFFVGGGGGG